MGGKKNSNPIYTAMGIPEDGTYSKKKKETNKGEALGNIVSAIKSRKQVDR